ncbi:MAG: PEP-utilizing enzyme [Promethearchaeota archaeon]
MEKIGVGLSCSSKSEVTGELVYIQTIDDVINLFDKAEGKICIVDDSGITTLSPILSDLVGTICTTGSAGSHLAIVSREFSIPCIMGVKFSIENISSLNGRMGKIIHEEDHMGILYLLD